MTYRALKRRKFEYSGDISIEHGGIFYCLDTYDLLYVDAVRVQPCSDAGGPDNLFWVECVTINIPDNDFRKGRALATLGLTLDDLAACANPQHLMVEATLACGLYDRELSVLVRVGPVDPFYGGREKFGTPDVVLRANASLRNYALKMTRGEYA